MSDIQSIEFWLVALIATMCLLGAFGVFARWCSFSPAVRRQQLERLRLGMTTAEVVALIGQPRENKQATNGSKQWIYGANDEAACANHGILPNRQTAQFCPRRSRRFAAIKSKAFFRRMKRSSLIRPLVRELHPYVPGEQPKIPGLIKLNTNENPYPPSPKVLRAVKAAVDERLRLYPNPTASLLREKLARLHRCAPENVIVGNGSDELLALAVRAFVEPEASYRTKELNAYSEVQHFIRVEDGKTTVQYFTPSYSLYPVLAATHGAKTNAVSLAKDFDLPSLDVLRKTRAWDFNAALTFVTTPNAPSGRGYSTADLEKLCRAQRGVVVLDEAYVDFAEENALALALKLPHVIVARTFSKAYSLCFQRVGYFVAHPSLIAALDKVRDSYNVNGLGQIAALATLDDLPYYRRNFQRVIATREHLTDTLREMEFQVFTSSTNFILAHPPRFPAKEWLEKLRAQKILVRWFDHLGLRDCLRISIGTDAEAQKLKSAVRRILSAR